MLLQPPSSVQVCGLLPHQYYGQAEEEPHKLEESAGPCSQKCAGNPISHLLSWVKLSVPRAFVACM